MKDPAKQAILWASSNRVLAERLPRLGLVKATVRRFMPGEDADAALEGATTLGERDLPTMFTHLGENVGDLTQAGAVVQGYLDILARIAEAGLDTEISLKLTHLGYDLDPEAAYANLERIAAEAERLDNRVWVDMESAVYVDGTIELFRRGLARFPTMGICLQTYLRRTPQDLADLLAAGASIRLVKGAYKESAEVALQSRAAIDETYRLLALEALRKTPGGQARLALGTHDVALLERIETAAAREGFGRDDYEIAMLYGIRTADQIRLRGSGHRVRVLISYGTHWYPWFMRRMAEKPSNIWFAVRNLVARNPV